MNMGHQAAYLQLFIMPYLLKFLFQAAYSTDYRCQKTTYNAFVQGSPWSWLLQERQTHSIPECLTGKKKPSAQFWMAVNKQIKVLDLPCLNHGFHL